MISALFAILLSGILPVTDSVLNRVWMESAVQGGEYRNIYGASSLIQGRIGAEGGTNIDKLVLSGRFEYGYDYGTGSSWRGWTEPYSTPFMVCDSIPGNISTEIYDMSAAAGYRLGQWTLGAACSYRNSLMAKHKDLRNKNLRMDFSIAPTIAWQGRKLGVSAYAGFRRLTEQVEYMQVDASSEKYLFQTYGLWFYSGSGFSSAESKRMLSGKGGFAGIGIKYDRDFFTICNDAAFNYDFSAQTETGYNNLHHGDTRSLKYSDILNLRAGRHELELSFAMQQMEGLRYLQRQELDPNSGIRRWFSYGAPSPVYWRDVLKLGGVYRYDGKDWSAFAGLSYMDASHSFKEYPELFTQSLGWLEPTLGGSKDFGLANSYGLRLSPALSYRHRLSGNLLESRKLENIAVSGDGLQLTAPMQAEYAYWSADAVKASLLINGWKALKGDRRLNAAIGLDYLLGIPDSPACFVGSSAEVKSSARTAIRLSLSYDF